MYPCMYTVYTFFEVCIYYLYWYTIYYMNIISLGKLHVSLICQYSPIYDRLELNPENSCNICNAS